MLYLFLFAHLVADFVLQPFWLVLRKRRWDGLLIHGAIVLACMQALALIDRAILPLWPIMLAVTAVHMATDWWKVRFGDRIPGPPIGPFMLDQVIHVATLCGVLCLALPASQVWSFDASPAAQLALYGSAYLIAACAAPIGVMVWLDPTFAKAALSGAARVRCLLAGSAVVTLTLFGGLIALPTTLLGVILAARHPRSAHPLDLPAGLMVVVCVGAVLGTALTLMR